MWAEGSRGEREGDGGTRCGCSTRGSVQDEVKAARVIVGEDA